MTNCESLYLTIGEPISHLDRLASIEEQWSELYQSTSLNSVFVSFDFIMLWYNCFAKPEQVRIYPVLVEDRIISFLPFFYYKKGPFRILSSPAFVDEYSQAGHLIAEGYEGVFMRISADTLFSGIKGWDALQYHGGYSFQTNVHLTLVQGRHLYSRDRSEPTYTILLNQPFDKYFNHNLSHKVRNNVKGGKKKLEKGHSYKFCHYTGAEAIASWPTFLSIEDSGWKGQNGSSIKRRTANIRSYYEGLICILSKNNLLHLYFLEIDGRAVAGLFGYVDRDVFQYAKSGYIEEYSSFSPSQLLFMYIIEDIINNFPTVKRLHMFPKDYGYKHRYVNEESFYSEATLYNRTIRGSTAYYLTLMKDRFKLLH